MIRLLVSGPPRTKKTHNVIARAGRSGRGRLLILPSDTWRRWAKGATITVLDMGGWPSTTWALRDARRPLADQPYNCAALFYRDADRGDAVGYYQGLADLLETRGVLTDDKWLVSWDGSRLLKDAANPRVDVILTTWPIGEAKAP